MNKPLYLLSQNKRIFVCVSNYALVCKKYSSYGNRWQIVIGDLVLFVSTEEKCIEMLEKLAKHIELNPRKTFMF